MNCCDCGELIKGRSYLCDSCGREMCELCIGEGDLCGECSIREEDHGDPEFYECLPTH